MPSDRLSIAIALALCCCLSPARVPAQQPAAVTAGADRARAAQATLPLAEVLKLHDRVREANEPGSQPPPTAATISHLELSGKLLDDSLELSGAFALAVLADDRWVQVPLLHLDAQSHLSSLPQVADGEFVIADDTLHFVTRRPGRYAFEVGWIQQARPEGPQRRLRIHHARAAMAVLHISYDEALFRLLGDEVRHRADGALIYPAADGFLVQWQRTARSAPLAERQPEARPPIESKVVSADASVVATLDGHRIVRLLYALQLQGEQVITFKLPQDLRVDKVYLNGAAVSHAAAGAALALQVHPPREGDRSARLELLLVGPQSAMNLSGRLDFTLPDCDWHLDELRVVTHLPQVFNYAWSGGSLSPAGELRPITYTHHLPTPGKQLVFGQQLVSSAPTLSVDYTVDLRGQYFDGRSRPAARPVLHQPAHPLAGHAQPVDRRADAVEDAWQNE